MNSVRLNMIYISGGALREGEAGVKCGSSRCAEIELYVAVVTHLQKMC